MKLKEEGFYGIIENFKKFFYITFVKNGGIREIDPNNLARELDDDIEYTLDTEERIIQILLFYDCLVEIIGFLPGYCYDTVEKFIIEYKINKFKILQRLTSDEQQYLEGSILNLIAQIHSQARKGDKNV